MRSPPATAATARGNDRFVDSENVVFVLNNGVDLSAVSDEEASFVYCFDSMVHFDSDVVRAYLAEFRRVLRPGGTAFCHYSNYTGDPTGSYRNHPGWRNFMSRELFEHYASKEALMPRESKLVRWTLRQFVRITEPTDAVTLLEKL